MIRILSHKSSFPAKPIHTPSIKNHLQPVFKLSISFRSLLIEDKKLFKNFNKHFKSFHEPIYNVPSMQNTIFRSRSALFRSSFTFQPKMKFSSLPNGNEEEIVKQLEEYKKSVLAREEEILAKYRERHKKYNPEGPDEIYDRNELILLEEQNLAKELNEKFKQEELQALFKEKLKKLSERKEKGETLTGVEEAALSGQITDIVKFEEELRTEREIKEQEELTKREQAIQASQSSVEINKEKPPEEKTTTTEGESTQEETAEKSETTEEEQLLDEEEIDLNLEKIYDPRVDILNIPFVDYYDKLHSDNTFRRNYFDTWEDIPTRRKKYIPEVGYSYLGEDYLTSTNHLKSERQETLDGLKLIPGTKLTPRDFRMKAIQEYRALSVPFAAYANHKPKESYEHFFTKNEPPIAVEEGKPFDSAQYITTKGHFSRIILDGEFKKKYYDDIVYTDEMKRNEIQTKLKAIIDGHGELVTEERFNQWHDLFEQEAALNAKTFEEMSKRNAIFRQEIKESQESYDKELADFEKEMLELYKNADEEFEKNEIKAKQREESEKKKKEEEETKRIASLPPEEREKELQAKSEREAQEKRNQEEKEKKELEAKEQSEAKEADEDEEPYEMDPVQVNQKNMDEAIEKMTGKKKKPSEILAEYKNTKRELVEEFVPGELEIWKKMKLEAKKESKTNPWLSGKTPPISNLDFAMQELDQLEGIDSLKEPEKPQDPSPTSPTSSSEKQFIDPKKKDQEAEDDIKLDEILKEKPLIYKKKPIPLVMQIESDLIPRLEEKLEFFMEKRRQRIAQEKEKEKLRAMGGQRRKKPNQKKEAIENKEEGVTENKEEGVTENKEEGVTENEGKEEVTENNEAETEQMKRDKEEIQVKAIDERGKEEEIETEELVIDDDETDPSDPEPIVMSFTRKKLKTVFPEDREILRITKTLERAKHYLELRTLVNERMERFSQSQMKDLDARILTFFEEAKTLLTPEEIDSLNDPPSNNDEVEVILSQFGQSKEAMRGELAELLDVSPESIDVSDTNKLLKSIGIESELNIPEIDVPGPGNETIQKFLQDEHRNQKYFFGKSMDDISRKQERMKKMVLTPEEKLQQQKAEEIVKSRYPPDYLAAKKLLTDEEEEALLEKTELFYLEVAQELSKMQEEEAKKREEETSNLQKAHFGFSFAYNPEDSEHITSEVAQQRIVQDLNTMEKILDPNSTPSNQNPFDNLIDNNKLRKNVYADGSVLTRRAFSPAVSKDTPEQYRAIEKHKWLMINSHKSEHRETIEEPNSVIFCRCWFSRKFPYCDYTGACMDEKSTYGPLIIHVKELPPDA